MAASSDGSFAALSKRATIVGTRAGAGRTTRAATGAAASAGGGCAMLVPGDASHAPSGDAEAEIAAGAKKRLSASRLPKPTKRHAKKTSRRGPTTIRAQE